MSSPSEKEQQLLKLSKSFDEALQSKNADKIKELLADNVVVHADEVTLSSDINGKDAVAQYFQAYWEKYTYEHQAICGAVDEKENVAFSFSADKDVTPKKDAFPNLPEDAYKPRTTVAIYKHEVNNDNKITAIWFLRQLSNDEMHRKLSNPPDFDSLKFDPFSYKGSDSGQADEFAEAHQKVADQFNQIWVTGDPSSADVIMEENVRDLNLVMAKEMNGRDKFKDMINGLFKSGGWQTRSSHVNTAVTAGNKAFIHWVSKGLDGKQGQEVQLYGINMLVFSDKQMIKEILGFSQPMPSMRKDLLKEE